MNDENFSITNQRIDVESVINLVVNPNAGAINTFIGTVRELTGGKVTLYLEYEAYVPMAKKKLAEIGKEINDKFPESSVAITHRIGRLEISDVAVVIAVATPHRAESFEASRYAIERIKEIVPIWKKEHWENGEMWLGNQSETIPYMEGSSEGEEK